MQSLNLTRQLMRADQLNFQGFSILAIVGNVALAHAKNIFNQILD